jgi:hypothetical protein
MIHKQAGVIDIESESAGLCRVDKEETNNNDNIGKVVAGLVIAESVTR